MGTPRKHIDRILLVLVALLVGIGLFVYASAALGLLARTNVSVTSIVLNHLLFGVVGGAIVMFITSRIPYRTWRRWAPVLFVLSLVATALVFLPVIGMESGGARRWLSLGSFTFQPGEALKMGTIFMLASLFATYRTKMHSGWLGLGIFLGIIALPALLLLLQPDADTLGVILIAAGAMFLVAGARWRDIGILALLGVVLFGALLFVRPYMLDRVTTFLNPMGDPLGSGYQIKQTLIAVGSGGVAGRGFGQSVQKFSYLPEPMSDSIFAVAAEEFGFIGSIVIIGLFLAFGARGFWIAARAPDYFGAVLGVGIVAYIVGQAFVNIAAMLGLIPLTGLPLVFISHGGSAMLIALASCGILLNISRYAKTA